MPLNLSVQTATRNARIEITDAMSPHFWESAPSEGLPTEKYLQ